MLTISIGKNKLESTGNNKKILVIFQSPIGIVYTAMNFWEPKKDFVSLLLLIDAILH